MNSAVLTVESVETTGILIVSLVLASNAIATLTMEIGHLITRAGTTDSILEFGALIGELHCNKPSEKSEGYTVSRKALKQLLKLRHNFGTEAAAIAEEIIETLLFIQLDTPPTPTGEKHYKLAA